MDLKKFLPGQSGDENSEQLEYYWAVVIEPGWVQAGVWRIAGGSAQVLYSSVPTPWELEEELVSATDTALSSAVQHFPETIPDPSKTVFGVISSWVSGGEIKEENLALIKKVCGDLSLKPVGFVVIPEAIAYLLKSEEGSVVNAVFLGVYKDTLEVSVFNLGNLMGSTSVARSLSIVDDVTEGLARFSGPEALPARFVLYNSRESELEECRQELTKHNWEETKTLNFLHTPKGEIITPEKKVYAVSLAGAAEIADVQTLAPKAIDRKEIPDVSSEPLPPELDNTLEATPEEFGFTVDDSQESTTPQNDLTPMMHQSLENLSAVTETEEAELIGNDTVKKPSILDSLKKSMPVFSRPKIKVGKPGLGAEGKRGLFVGIAVLLAVFIGSFVLWWYYPSATAVIYISPQRLDERIELTVSPDITEVNVSNGELPAEKLTVNVKGEKTKSTTGTKTVGDKATGEVTLYRVGSQLNIPEGTVLQGPDTLKFVLDSAVTIASGSAGSPGTTKAAVSAEDIGSDYNLSSGTTFRVGNFSTSDIEAKNENDFSGGTSREISAVSTEDQETLLSELENELNEKAISELEGKVADGSFIIKDSLLTTQSSKNFSAKVGDESSSLKLSLEVIANALAVERSQLTELLNEVLKDKVPEGYVLREEQVESEFNVSRTSGSGFVFETNVEANLLPRIDTDEIAKRIAGKYKSVAEEYLQKELPGFVSAQITVRPRLPGRLGSLPRVPKRIDIELSAE